MDKIPRSWLDSSAPNLLDLSNTKFECLMGKIPPICPLAYKSARSFQTRTTIDNLDCATTKYLSTNRCVVATYHPTNSRSPAGLLHQAPSPARHITPSSTRSA